MTKKVIDMQEYIKTKAAGNDNQADIMAFYDDVIDEAADEVIWKCVIVSSDLGIDIASPEFIARVAQAVGHFKKALYVGFGLENDEDF